MLSKTDHYFLTIAETGNLNRAAELLYVSQPSLSKYIQRLEAQLGTELFDRSVSPMKLNEAGTLYLTHLMEAMEREQQLLNRLQELRGEIRGTLRLGIPPFCGQCYLPKVLPRFSAEYPHVEVLLYEGMGDEIEQALCNQKIDLAILPHPVGSDGLSYRPLFSESVLLVTRRADCNEADATPEHFPIRTEVLSDFYKQPVILPHPSQKLGKLVTDYFGRIGCRPSVYTSTQSAATTLSLVAAGMGVGFVPNAGLDTCSEGILRKLRFYDPGPDMQKLQFVSVTRKGTELSTFSRRFLELFQEATEGAT